VSYVFRILSVFASVKAKINMSSNADASHAAAESGHRTTVFQNLNRRAENVERTNGAVFVRLKREKKVGKRLVIMAINVRFF
jgi:hypothetical protein